MVKFKSGHLVAISSMQGKLGIAERSTYAASKHAIIGYYDSLRAEVIFFLYIMDFFIYFSFFFL